MLVAVTGYGQESDRRRAHEAGFDEFLVKPLLPEVARALALKGPSRTRRPPDPGAGS
jgi:CheY-like chemotaxis protein